MTKKNKFHSKKRTFLKKLSFLSSFLTVPLVISACTHGADQNPEQLAQQNPEQLAQTWDTKVNLGLSQSWFQLKTKEEPDRVNNFLSNLTEEFKKLKEANPLTKDLPDVTFHFVGNDDAKAKLSLLKSSNNSENALDFAIADATTTIEDDQDKQLYNGLQTLTWAFKNSPESAVFYTNGTENDPLYKGAKELNELFNKTPYNEWSSDPNDAQKWDKIAYRFLYDDSNPRKIISYYRGMIMIYGDEKTRAEIKKSWHDKDWPKFRNYGIIHGKLTSAGKFKMQNFILKKHFGSSFSSASLNEDRLGHSDRYIQGRGYTIGQDPKFRIAFDDEASFAWTENKKDSKQYTSSETDSKPDSKVEIFMLTNPASYDIGSYRPTFNKLQADLISQAFVNMAKNGKDEYGPNVGYNGYRKINQQDPEFRKIYDQSKSN
ncbi:DNA repair protein [Mesomycoplasma ovipneumoniae]|uniref:ABC transporter thiamine pyrophosphate-binding lipoprotein p37/Cypl n=1 Tax=Mesomycoplasma ovipneumoniae TaxID=29562 RepID=UPI0026E38215|nr:DNA repair protein [Mesomycoplasma ovipneumoniae]MDO6857547.1 DNA repair protein [Mesomycoplasma ovipneumoniae]